MDDLKIAKLSFIGALFTLVVISLGAWVRLTDAGLGCPDWPGCYGLLTTPDTADELAKAKEYYPDADIDVGKAWREMLHRYMAGILGLYVFFITFISVKYSKKKLHITGPLICSNCDTSNYGHAHSNNAGKTYYRNDTFIFWNVNCHITFYKCY
jgi:heme A synthase